MFCNEEALAKIEKALGKIEQPNTGPKPTIAKMEGVEERLSPPLTLTQIATKVGGNKDSRTVRKWLESCNALAREGQRRP